MEKEEIPVFDDIIISTPFLKGELDALNHKPLPKVMKYFVIFVVSMMFLLGISMFVSGMAWLVVGFLSQGIDSFLSNSFGCALLIMVGLGWLGFGCVVNLLSKMV